MDIHVKILSLTGIQATFHDIRAKIKIYDPKFRYSSHFSKIQSKIPKYKQLVEKSLPHPSTHPAKTPPNQPTPQLKLNPTPKNNPTPETFSFLTIF
jgi:hypothetical protein